MEMLDIVDADGNPTGRTVDRVTAHREGIPHRTAHLWLVRRSPCGVLQILLQKRAAQKDSFPGCYDISSAGHIPAGSDILESALRELREELGVEARPEELRYLGKRHIHTESVFHGAPFLNDQVSFVYWMECPLDESSFRTQPSEVESVRWMGLEDCIRGVREHAFPNCLSAEELHWLQACGTDLSNGGAGIRNAAP